MKNDVSVVVFVSSFFCWKYLIWFCSEINIFFFFSEGVACFHFSTSQMLNIFTCLETESDFYFLIFSYILKKYCLVLKSELFPRRHLNFSFLTELIGVLSCDEQVEDYPQVVSRLRGTWLMVICSLVFKLQASKSFTDIFKFRFDRIQSCFCFLRYKYFFDIFHYFFGSNVVWCLLLLLH